MPDAAPVRQKMLFSSSKGSLKTVFEDIKFIEVSKTEKSEVTVDAFLEKTGMTREQKLECMTATEVDLMLSKEKQAKEQESGPKLLPGMAAVRIKTQESFDDAIAKLLANETKLVLGSLTGPTSEEICGELMDDVETPMQLRGRLPTKEIRFVIFGLEGEPLLFFTWLPDEATIKQKMRCSAFKGSVYTLLKERAQPRTVVQAEVTSEDDLNDDLGKGKVELTGSPGEVPDSSAETSAPASSPGKFKPPPGAVAMPGMFK